VRLTNLSPGIEAIRAQFPIFKRKIFLNSCSQGALSEAVEASLLAHIRSWHEQGSPWDRWVEEYENARTAFARFIGADRDEVAVVPSASAGINSVASALDFGKRRKVIMGEFEFPTMGQIWLAQRPRGAEIEFIEATDGKIRAECYVQAIDEQTLIVPLTQVCFMTGFRSDITLSWRKLTNGVRWSCSMATRIAGRAPSMSRLWAWISTSRVRSNNCSVLLGLRSCTFVEI